MTLIVGVDGGKSGAIAFLAPDAASVRVYDIPRIVRRTRGKERTEVDPDALGALLALEFGGDDVRAFLEVGVGDRRQSTAAGYDYGFANGAIWMAFRLRLPRSAVVLVHPTTWKRSLGLIGHDKEASRNKALRMFPASKNAFAKRSDHNRAEAALIALYGYRLHA